MSRRTVGNVRTTTPKVSLTLMLEPSPQMVRIPDAAPAHVVAPDGAVIG